MRVINRSNPGRALTALLLQLLLALASFGGAAADVCTLSVDGVSGFTSYAGVGFQENLAAYLYGTRNGQPDNQIGDYQAQID